MSLNKYLTIENESRIRKLKIDQIVYFLYKGYSVQIFIKGEKTVFCTKTLKYFEEKLCAHDFFRISKNTLVNMHFIDEYNKTDRLIKLYDNTKLIVPYKKVKDFTTRYRDLKSL